MRRNSVVTFAILIVAFALSGTAFAQKGTVLRVIIVKTDNLPGYVQELDKGKTLLKVSIKLERLFPTVCTQNSSSAHLRVPHFPRSLREMGFLRRHTARVDRTPVLNFSEKRNDHLFCRDTLFFRATISPHNAGVD